MEGACTDCMACGGDVDVPSPPPPPVSPPMAVDANAGASTAQQPQPQPQPATAPQPAAPVAPRPQPQPAAHAPAVAPARPPRQPRPKPAAAPVATPCFRLDCLRDLTPEQCPGWAKQGLCESPDTETQLRMHANCMLSCFRAKPPPPPPPAPRLPPAPPPPAGSTLALAVLLLALLALLPFGLILRRRLAGGLAAAPANGHRSTPKAARAAKVKNPKQLLPSDDPDGEREARESRDDDILGDEDAMEEVDAEAARGAPSRAPALKQDFD